jgi:hypothetical protein
MMKLKTLSATVIAASLAAGTAYAQQSFVEIEDNVMVQPFNANADTVEDWDVYSPAGVEIADVEDVIGTDAQTPTALVVDFDDNAGFGDRDDVIVPLDQFTWQDNRLVLNADAAAVSAMPVWND